MRVVLSLLFIAVYACGSGTSNEPRKLGESSSSNTNDSTSGTGGLSAMETPQASTNNGSGTLSTSSGGDCKPGRYVGDFSGTYRSQVWGNGDPAAALMVNGLADPITGVEPLEFRLEKAEEVQCAANDEFCGGFKVTGGKMMGGADPSNTGIISVHFEIDLTGDLDCRTGEFRGKLSNGFYDVATVLYYFEGDIVGKYDSSTSSFYEGEWSVVEEPKPGLLIPPDQSIGGEGTWQASWVEP